MRRMALAAALAAASGAARADCAGALVPGAPPPGLTEASVPAAVVTGWVPGIFFVKDKAERAGCPDESPECQQATSVEPGEAVLLNKPAVGEYTCATYLDADGVATTGWLPTIRLAVIARSVPGPQDWEGDWTAPEKEIKIALTPSGDLALAGSATWGAADPERVMRGGVHLGAFKAELQPAGAVLGFAEGRDGTLPFDAAGPEVCAVQLARRGPYLVAADNGACGGANVTFTGMYRRE